VREPVLISSELAELTKSSFDNLSPDIALNVGAELGKILGARPRSLS